jgi:Flp pilus assembly protein TadB
VLIRHRVKTNKKKHRGELRCSLDTEQRQIKQNKGELRCSLDTRAKTNKTEHLSSPLFCFICLYSVLCLMSTWIHPYVLFYLSLLCVLCLMSTWVHPYVLFYLSLLCVLCLMSTWVHRVKTNKTKHRGELRWSLDTRHRVKTNKTKHRGELRCSLDTRHRVKTNKTKHRGELRWSFLCLMITWVHPYVLFYLSLLCVLSNDHLSSPLCFVLLWTQVIIRHKTQSKDK